MADFGTITLTRHIPFAPERVWLAVSDPQIQAKWWAPGDIKPVVGHRFELDMGTFGNQQCEIIEVEPERKLVYLFGIGFLNTTITWTLEPAGDGTDLTLEQSGFDLESPMGQAAYQGMSGGWPVLLPKIEQALAE